MTTLSVVEVDRVIENTSFSSYMSSSTVAILKHSVVVPPSMISSEGGSS